MLAAKLLDSRSFKNKLDFFVSVASRKRPRPTDEELAEALEPVLEAATGQSGAPVAPSEIAASIGADIVRFAKPSVVGAKTAQEAQAQIDAQLAGEMARLAAATPKGPYVAEQNVHDHLFADFCERAHLTAPNAEGVRIVSLPLDVTVADLQEYIGRVKPGVGVSENHMVMTGPNCWLVPVYA